jgi:hypothetical protein
MNTSTKAKRCPNSGKVCYENVCPGKCLDERKQSMVKWAKAVATYEAVSKLLK